jgi:hypothetical protein
VWLYVGAVSNAALIQSKHKALNITAVINACRESPNFWQGDYPYFTIPIKDERKWSVEFGQFFTPACDFLQAQHAQQRNVLVHGMKGIQWSRRT